jgi:hypothetical protein
MSMYILGSDVVGAAPPIKSTTLRTAAKALNKADRAIAAGERVSKKGGKSPNAPLLAKIGTVAKGVGKKTKDVAGRKRKVSPLAKKVDLKQPALSMKGKTLGKVQPTALKRQQVLGDDWYQQFQKQRQQQDALLQKMKDAQKQPTDAPESLSTAEDPYDPNESLADALASVSDIIAEVAETSANVQDKLDQLPPGAGPALARDGATYILFASGFADKANKVVMAQVDGDILRAAQQVLAQWEGFRDSVAPALDKFNAQADAVIAAAGVNPQYAAKKAAETSLFKRAAAAIKSAMPAPAPTPPAGPVAPGVPGAPPAGPLQLAPPPPSGDGGGEAPPSGGGGEAPPSGGEEGPSPFDQGPPEGPSPFDDRGEPYDFGDYGQEMPQEEAMPIEDQPYDEEQAPPQDDEMLGATNDEPYIVSPGYILTQMNRLNSDATSLQKDIWREFPGSNDFSLAYGAWKMSWEKFYKDNGPGLKGWTGRFWGSTMDAVKTFENDLAGWKDKFRSLTKQAGKSYDPVSAAAPKKSDEFPWDTVAAVAGGVVGVAAVGAGGLYLYRKMKRG